MKKLQLVNFRQNEFLIILAALFIYTIAAYFSKGYYHPDEHFQILEFANFKLGKINKEDLPWEFADQIRSSFQPWVAFVLMKILLFLNIHNPYIIALILRLLTGYIALFAIRRFIHVNMHMVEGSYQFCYIILSYFLWFLPFINVRFSSETWSGIFFLYATTYVDFNKKTKWLSIIKIGLFCGLSFLCRFQAAVMVGGLILWLLLIKKEGVKSILILLLFCTLIIGCGILLDRVYYGEWVISFWNYFNANIIKDIASHFGTTPIYAFIYQIIFNQIFIVGLLVFSCFIFVLVEEPKSLVAWCVLPLFICHLVIPHKEVRFLFPIVNFIPLLLIKGWQHINLILIKLKYYKYFIPILLICLFSINFFALSISIFVAPTYGRIALTNYVYDHYKNIPIIIYSIDREEEDPTIPYSFIRQSFYEMPNISNERLDSYLNLEKDMFTKDTLSFVVCRKFELKNQVLKEKIKELNLHILTFGNFNWVVKLEGLYFEDENIAEYVLIGNKANAL